MLASIKRRLQSLFIRSYIECSASTISKAVSRLQTSVTAMGVNSAFCMFKILKSFRKGGKHSVVGEGRSSEEV
ncbi:MAG: hypothetical protein QXH99_03580 [Sulfolobales archaeon]|jgi:hypothetical protein